MTSKKHRLCWPVLFLEEEERVIVVNHLSDTQTYIATVALAVPELCYFVGIGFVAFVCASCWFPIESITKI